MKKLYGVMGALLATCVFSTEGMDRQSSPFSQKRGTGTLRTQSETTLPTPTVDLFSMWGAPTVAEISTETTTLPTPTVNLYSIWGVSTNSMSKVSASESGSDEESVKSQQEIKTLQQEIERLQQENERLMNEPNAMFGRMMGGTIDELKARNSKLIAENESLTQAREQLIREVKCLQEELAKTKNNTRLVAFGELLNELTNAQSVVETMRKKLLTVLTQKAVEEEDVAELSLANAFDEIKKLQERVIEQLTQQVANAQKVDEKQKEQIEQLTEELNKTRQATEKQNEQIEQLTKQLEDTQKFAEEQRKQIERLTKQLEDQKDDDE